MRHDDDYDLDLDGPDEVEAPARAGLGRTLSAWTGTLVALALVAGVGAWAYGLGTRDPARIPVIAAMAGPVKINLASAEQGSAAAHQDIASYDAGQAAAPATGTTLAPPPPRPAPEDVAMGDLASIFGQGAAPTPAVQTGPATPATEPAAEEERLAAIDPAAPAAEEAAAEPEEPAGPMPPPGEGSEYAPAVSPRVLVRPVDLRRRIAAAQEEAVAEALALAERAARSPYQIQLGAFRNEVLTREQWQLIAGTHSELLHNRALAVQQTRSGGDIFYRLRVGPFESRDEAASLCQALEARGQTCIVARNDG